MMMIFNYLYNVVIRQSVYCQFSVFVLFSVADLLTVFLYVVVLCGSCVSKLLTTVPSYCGFSTRVVIDSDFTGQLGGILQC